MDIKTLELCDRGLDRVGLLGHWVGSVGSSRRGEGHQLAIALPEELFRSPKWQTLLFLS